MEKVVTAGSSLSTRVRVDSVRGEMELERQRGAEPFAFVRGVHANSKTALLGGSPSQPRENRRHGVPENNRW